MKRLLVLVLLVPILALTMISCDADMRSNIANLMGGFGGNIYEDAGLVVANTAQAKAAAAAVAAIGTAESVEVADTSSFGVTIAVLEGVTTILAPQTPAKQTELKNNLADALNSETQKEQLLEDLKKPVTDAGQKEAAQGTVKVFNATLDALKTQLGGSDTDTDLGLTLGKLKLPVIAADDELTQGDMLALQLMTDLISNTVATLTEIGTLGSATGAALGLAENKNKILSIIDDALFAAQMAEQISGASSIDFTGQIDLGSLLAGFGSKGTRSRGEPIALTEAANFIGVINDLAPSIVDLMGITYEAGNFVYDKDVYKSFLLNQQVYRSSMEQALKMMELGGNLGKDDIDSLTFDTSTLVKYTLAVFITEHDAFWVATSPSGASTPNEIIALYLNDSVGNKKLGLGTLTSTDVLTQPSVITGFNYDNWPAFIKDGAPEDGFTLAVVRDLPYYQAIVSNIIRINDLGGIAQLSTELKKFYDPAYPTAPDGLSNWYVNLLLL